MLKFNFAGGWGKRAEWKKLSAAWGKWRSLWQLYNQVNDQSGKRANNENNKWNNLSGMWGKRDDKWNRLSGMWGKRGWKDMSSAWGLKYIIYLIVLNSNYQLIRL